MDVNLSTLEEKILDFADSMANSDTEITINNLFNTAKINSQGSAVEISKAINSLISKSYIVPGKRVTKDQLLLNGKRYRIYFYIRNNPSCSSSDIKEFTKIKEILINWHLAVLEEFQFIFHAEYQGKLVLYPIEYKDKLNTAAVEESKLKTETIRPKIRLMDILGRKIIDALDIVSMLEKIGVACEERFIVGELVSFLDQTQHKIEKTFPYIAIGEQIQDNIKNMKTAFQNDAEISTAFGTDLLFEVIKWLTTIYNITINNFKIYEEAFPEDSQNIQQLNNVIRELNIRIARIHHSYAFKILRYLLVIEKNSGLPLYEYNFQQVSLQPEVLSGFLSAIQRFGVEISDETSPMKNISYKNFQIELDVQKQFISALIINGKITDYLNYLLGSFTKEFNAKYSKVIENWKGDKADFQDVQNLCETIFQ